MLCKNCWMRGVGLVTIIGSAEVYERNDVSFLIAKPEGIVTPEEMMK